MANFGSSTMGLHGSLWEANGYSGGGNVGSLVNSLRGRPAVVCGSASGVFEQFEKVMNKLDGPVVFAVNDVGVYLRRVDHWVSLHSGQFEQWRPVRWLHHRGPEDTKYHGVDEAHLVDYAWLINPTMALSGYFALQIAWIMGCSFIVLCGCPGDNTPKFYEAERLDFGYGSGGTQSDKGIRQQIVNETNRLPDLKNAIRSMSGWTRDYFGGF